jgi:hypothetical protein
MLTLIHYVLRVTVFGFCIFSSRGMEFTGVFGVYDIKLGGTLFYEHECIIHLIAY